MSTIQLTPLGFQPVIVLGAPRSGTNLLRDLLCASQGVETWPCDEINYLWRHGDPGRPTDHYTAADATPGVVHFLRRSFARQAMASGARWLVEKTCANCLRVEFIQRVFPEAKFIVIHRDGRDAVASALLRWRGGFNLGYVLRKARYVPARDLQYYARRFLSDRLHQVASRERRVRSWGPKFEGLDVLLREASLAAACAEQWRQCVDRVDASLDSSSLPTHRLTYESLVGDPTSERRLLEQFLGVESCTHGPDIRRSSIGVWRQKLDAQALADILPRIGPTLIRLGYLAHKQAA